MDVNKIISAAKAAFEKPRHGQEVNVDGFRFHIYWMPEEGWFEAQMFFAPEWGHSHSICARSPEELAERVSAEIEDAKQIFTNGGKFVDESHLNENKSKHNIMEKQVVNINEAELRQIVSESVKSMLKEDWAADYNAAMDKVDYNNAKNAWDERSLFQKIVGFIKRERPNDPNPEKTAEELANAYVESFNSEHNMGTRSDYANDGSMHTKMYYQSGNMRPVLKATRDDGNGYYQERKAFDEKGNEEEWGIEYPYSELGATGRPNPENQSNDVRSAYRKFDAARDEVGSVMRDRYKKTKVSESQLRQIVKESVKGVLMNELFGFGRKSSVAPQQKIKCGSAAPNGIC